MGNFIQTLSQDISGPGGHEIHFRPGEVGQINIQSHIVSPGRQPPGEPLYEFTISLLRPGQTTPFASKRTTAGQTVLTLNHTITAADLVPAGDWTCFVENGSGPVSTLATTLTYPTGWPIHTVSFDIELLNLLIIEALKVAQPKMHLQSSSQQSDNESQVSWSEAATKIFGGPIMFHLPEFRTSWSFIPFTYRVVNLETLDITANMSTGAPPAIEVQLTFTDGDHLRGGTSHTPDIDIRSLKGHLEILFDGSISASFSVSAHVYDVGIDVSDTVASQLASSLTAQLQKAAVRTRLDAFFSGLLRLGANAVIIGYDVAGGALIVSYIHPNQPSTASRLESSIVTAKES